MRRPGKNLQADAEELSPAEAAFRARSKAVELLSRREHSVRELGRKLTQRGIDEELTDRVISGLNDKGLVSDQRFAESLVTRRAGRGQGPIRIKAELAEHGVESEAVEKHLAEVDWNALARTVRQRKFGATLPRTLAERAKQSRFLQYRGFTADQIRRAFDASFEDIADDAGPPD